MPFIKVSLKSIWPIAPEIVSVRPTLGKNASSAIRMKLANKAITNSPIVCGSFRYARLIQDSPAESTRRRAAISKSDNMSQGLGRLARVASPIAPTCPIARWAFCRIKPI